MNKLTPCMAVTHHRWTRQFFDIAPKLVDLAWFVSVYPLNDPRMKKYLALQQHHAQWNLHSDFLECVEFQYYQGTSSSMIEPLRKYILLQYFLLDDFYFVHISSTCTNTLSSRNIEKIVKPFKLDKQLKI